MSGQHPHLIGEGLSYPSTHAATTSDETEVTNESTRIQARDSLVNSATYASLLQKCVNMKALAEGRRVHAQIIRSGFKGDVTLENHLIVMYVKCGCIVDARKVFDTMFEQDVVSWNAMIGGYINHGHSIEALKLFQIMQQKGVRPDKITFIIILNACTRQETLTLGKLLHAWIVDAGYELDVVVGNALVNMYGKCTRINDARRMFDKMATRNVVSWTTMISGYSRNRYCEEAFRLFQQMQQEDVQPNKITFISILNVCASLESLAFGKLVHAHIVDRGIELDGIVGNALVNMYEKCGYIDSARRMFDKMPVRDVVSWTALIAGYSRHGHVEEAFHFFQQMSQAGLKLNKITFISILNGCASSETLALGKLIHAHIVGIRFESDVIIGTALVNMYRKCGSIIDARRTFDKMPERNLVSWNTMITAYSRHGQDEEAFKLFQQMQQEGAIPNNVTFVSVLNSCSSPETLALGKLIHAQIFERGFELDDTVRNALINMYGKCGSVENACTLFNKMPLCNIVSWNVMIALFSQYGYCEEAFKLFWQMQQNGLKPSKITFINILTACTSYAALALGKLVHAHVVDSGVESDDAVGNALVNMYARCGSINDAQMMFDKMPERNVISWTSIISGYSRHGHVEEVFKLFEQMQREGTKPNKITFICVVNACACPEVLALGKLLHAHIRDGGFELDDVVGTALIDMYGKCGSIEDAGRLFERMPKRDVVLWNAMIAAYAQHGHGMEALKVFEQMQRADVKPVETTFVSVLNACSHAGLVDEGLHYFHSMSQQYCIQPTMGHYNCVVDLLGRAGRLDEAEDFINRMPFPPDAVIWMTLLASCRTYGCIDRGKHAAECAVHLDPQLPSAYVVLSNIYAAADRWTDVTNVRELMADGCKEGTR